MLSEIEGGCITIDIEIFELGGPTVSKKKIVSITAGILITSLLLVIGGGTFLFNYFYFKMDITEPFIPEEVGVIGKVAQKEKESNIINIALVGMNSNSSTSKSRSDLVKVISLDMSDKLVKLTSIQPDMLVYIPGSDKKIDKLSHAYGNGEVQSILTTLNYNFDLDITRYVAFNLDVIEPVIELIDGIELDIPEDELKIVNDNIQYLNNSSDTDSEMSYLKTGGVQKLLGRQVMAYMRNSYENGNLTQIERQSKVMDAIIDKIMNESDMNLLALLDACLPYIETNLTMNEMINLGMNILTFDLEKIDKLEITVLDSKDNLTSSKVNSPFDTLDNYQKLVRDVHAFIYDDTYYQTSKSMVDMWILLEKNSDWVATSSAGYFFRSTSDNSVKNTGELIE